MSHTGLKDEAGVILYLSTSPMKIPAQHIVSNQHKKVALLHNMLLKRHPMNIYKSCCCKYDVHQPTAGTNPKQKAPFLIGQKVGVTVITPVLFLGNAWREFLSC